MVGMDYGAQECVTGLENMLWGPKTVDDDGKRVQTCSNIHERSTVFGTCPTRGRALKQLKKINIVTRYVKRTKMGKQKLKKE